MAIRRGVLRPALLALLLFLPGPRVFADVAAKGTFDIQLALAPPNVPFTGNISFDPETQTALGRSIDMDTDVGDMTYQGTAAVDLVNESATFNLSAQSDVDFAFTASGAGSCENAGCVNGRGTFAGRFTTITDPSDVLPEGVYTFDGTAEINFAGQGPGGVFAVNAFPLIPTPIGSDVTVSSGPQTFFDTVAAGLRDFTASARFASVGGAGSTQFVAFSALPGAFPAGVNQNAMVAIFVDVATNAMVTGNVHVCLSYPDANNDGIVDGTINSISITRLRLLHAAAIGAPFADVTGSVGNQQACGDVPSVGPFVIGVAPVAATTTTSTTTSTTSPSHASTTTTITVSPGGTTTTSTTLPVCATALDCLDIAIAGPLCPGETLNQKLGAVILKKLTKARTALLATRATSVAKKIAKLIGKAHKQIDRIGAKADAFVSKPKGAISVDCRNRILTAIGRVTQQIEANRI